MFKPEVSFTSSVWNRFMLELVMKFGTGWKMSSAEYCFPCRSFRGKTLKPAWSDRDDAGMVNAPAEQRLILFAQSISVSGR